MSTFSFCIPNKVFYIPTKVFCIPQNVFCFLKQAFSHPRSGTPASVARAISCQGFVFAYLFFCIWGARDGQCWKCQMVGTKCCPQLTKSPAQGRHQERPSPKARSRNRSSPRQSCRHTRIETWTHSQTQRQTDKQTDTQTEEDREVHRSRAQDRVRRYRTCICHAHRPCRTCGRRNAATSSGAVLQAARKVAAEVGGRWSQETADFLNAKAKAKAEEYPQILQGRVRAACVRRWECHVGVFPFSA